ncbi:MAG TPA: glycosyl hydrolase, partial [Myxococcota bacterium]|nr:glycosyl hydrolase [Myxococcota bacterium]
WSVKRPAERMRRERPGEAWAGARGMLTRVQNHGMEIDVLQAAGAVSIPESEQLYAGGSDLFLKVAASGAQLHGRSLVSAEAFVSPGRDHMLTPAKLRALADKAFGAGINQLVLHGFAYDAAGAYGPSGWTPFSSPHGGTNTYAAHFGPQGGLWEFLPALNTYLGRCQWLLRQGRPVADLLVYYPWLGFPSSLALEPTYLEPLLGGYLEGMEPELREMPFASLAALFGPQITAPRTAWLLALAPVLAALESAGVTWAWVNDERLEALRLRAGRLEVAGASYGALLVFQAPWMEPAAAAHLAALGGDGAAVLSMGPAPTSQPGYGDREAGDARVARSFERLEAGSRSRLVRDAPELLAALPDVGAGPGVGVLPGDGAGPEWRLLARRLSQEGYLFFVRNPSLEDSSGRLQIRGGCPEARFWDAWAGEISRAAVDSEGLVPLRLGALESVFLVCGDGAEPPGTLDRPAWARRLGDGARAEPLTAWHLRVEGADVEGGMFEADLDALQDWRGLPGLQSCGSPGTYTTAFELVEGFTRVEIDLGWVQGTARVRVNGQAAGELLVPPFRLEVASLARPGENALEVEVQVPRRNRLVGLAEAGDPLAAQFQGKSATRIASGLLGPAFVWAE